MDELAVEVPASGLELVPDDAGVREVVRRMLEGAGLDSISASSPGNRSGRRTSHSSRTTASPSRISSWSGHDSQS